MWMTNPLLQTVVRMSIMTSPPAWINSAGMLSTQTDFPIFNALSAASTSSMLFIWYLWAVKYCWPLTSLIAVKVCAVLCPPVKYFILLCETLLRLVSYDYFCKIYNYVRSSSAKGMVPLISYSVQMDYSVFVILCIDRKLPFPDVFTADQSKAMVLVLLLLYWSPRRGRVLPYWDS